MKNLIAIVSITAALVWALFLTGCPVVSGPDPGGVDSPDDFPSSVPDEYTPQYAIPDNYVPGYAVDEAERYKTAFLAQNAASAADLAYRFFYNENGEACIEYTVTPKGGYTWNTPVWIGYKWYNSTGSIGNAEITYTITKKRLDEAAYCMEERRKDPVFSE